MALRLGGLMHDIAAVAEERVTIQEPAPLPSYAEPAAPTTALTQSAARSDGSPGKVEESHQATRLPANPFELTDEEIELLQALSERRQEIEARAEQIQQREALLSAAESRIDEKVSRLESLQKQIQEQLARYDEQEEKQLQSLVKIYEAMKPKDAARIFDELEMKVLLSVIDRMNERKSAPVLAEMTPQRAQEVTLELATRRELPLPRE